MARKVTEAQYAKAIETLARWNTQIALEDIKADMGEDFDLDEVSDLSDNYLGDMYNEIGEKVHELLEEL